MKAALKYRRHGRASAALCFCFCLGLLLCCVSIPARAQSAQELCTKGAAAEKNEQFEEAYAAYVDANKKGGCANSEAAQSRLKVLADTQRQNEDRYFKLGKQAFDSGNFDEAKKNFDIAITTSLKMKTPAHKDEIDGLRKRVDDENAEQAIFNQAMNLYRQDPKSTAARDLFQQVVNKNGKNRAAAQSNFTQINTEIRNAAAAAKAAGDTKAAEEAEQSDFDRAMNLYRQDPKSTAARDLFQQVVSKNGKNRTAAQNNITLINNEIRNADVAAKEQEAWNKALEAFNKKAPEARELLKSVAQMGGTHAAEANSNIGSLDRDEAEARSEQTLFDNAKRLFDQGNGTAARKPFGEVVKLHGKNRAAAEDYLGKIDRAIVEGNIDGAFRQAVDDYNRQRYASAKSLFESILRKGGSHASEVRDYLAKIPVVPDKPKDDQTLLAKLNDGLTSFFSGNYGKAYASLTEYIEKQGAGQDLARFYRGASAAGRSYLAAEKGVQEKQRALALQDFSALKSFTPPSPTARFVPAKIMTLYTQAAGTSAR